LSAISKIIVKTKLNSLKNAKILQNVRKIDCKTNKKQLWTRKTSKRYCQCSPGNQSMNISFGTCTPFDCVILRRPNARRWSCSFVPNIMVGVVWGGTEGAFSFRDVRIGKFWHLGVLLRGHGTSPSRLRTTHGVEVK
jgi:hypothetical protein